MTDQPTSPDSREWNYDLDAVFPHPGHLLDVVGATFESIRDDCIIVPDANVLLVPYNVGSDSLEEIQKLYKSLLDRNQLRIPGHVVREFVRNRSKKFQDLYQALNKTIEKAANLPLSSYPVLEPLASYQKVLGTQEKLKRVVTEFSSDLNAVMTDVRSWTWDDPVSKMYRALFTASIITEDVGTRQDLGDDFDRRCELKIPPGYKDAGKAANSMGDYLIWKAILHLGQTEKKHVAFVTGEEKADWWHRSEGKPLYARFELAEEFWRASSQRSLVLMKFSDLLTSFGVKKEVVDEVKSKEQIADPVDSFSYEMASDTDTQFAVAAAARYFSESDDFVRFRSARGRPDFEITYRDGSRKLYEIIDARGSLGESMARHVQRLIGGYRSWVRRIRASGGRRSVWIVVVARDEGTGQFLWEWLAAAPRVDLAGGGIFVGYLLGESFAPVGQIAGGGQELP